MHYFLFGLIAALSLSAPSNAATRKSTISQLVQSGQSMECSYSKMDQGITRAGTFYVAGKKMRGDFTTTRKGSAPMIGHMLQDGTWVYSWGGPSGEIRGTKFKVSELQKHTSTHKKEGPDLDQEVDMDCRPWAGEAASFIPPANITFQDMTSQMVDMQQGKTPAMGSACAACEQAPAGASREQCKQALGCK